MRALLFINAGTLKDLRTIPETLKELPWIVGFCRIEPENAAHHMDFVAIVDEYTDEEQLRREKIPELRRNHQDSQIEIHQIAPEYDHLPRSVEAQV